MTVPGRLTFVSLLVAFSFYQHCNTCVVILEVAAGQLGLLWD